MAKTAAEFMAELAKNKKYQEMKRLKDETLEKFKELLKEDQEGLVSELSDILGYRVNSVYDLVNRKNDYEKAIPVLIKHLKVDHHPKIVSGICRALAVRELSEDENLWKTLVVLYEKTKPNVDIATPEYRGVKGSIAVALSELTTEERVPEVKRLISLNPDIDEVVLFKERIIELQRRSRFTRTHPDH